MEKDIVNKMHENTVFMASMSTRFGLLQTVQSLAQAAVRSPEPIKSALATELGGIICLMQWMIMLYGNGNVSLTIPAKALNKAGEIVRVDVSELTKDLKTVSGHTIATWADQTLNGELWERTSEALGHAIRTA